MGTVTEHLLAWLRDALAMEEESITLLISQSRRLRNYPDLKARIDMHLQETRDQAAMIERCLERLGGEAATAKDVTGRMVTLGHAFSGLFIEDGAVKGTLANYTFEQMEIASYKILIAAADGAGDRETKQTCETILQQEIAMAEWLDQHAGQITRKFLDRAERGVAAKRGKRKAVLVAGHDQTPDRREHTGRNRR